MKKEVVERLIEIVGSDNVSTATADKITHSYDATQEQHLPDAVVYVSTTEQVSRIVKLANEVKIPVLPRGAGSGFTGGTLPTRGGIVMVLTRMDKILDIDSENLTAEVEPGVVTAELQRRAEKLGLFYPPDPASKEFSTLGGNVAECAGGPRCVKYGVTKDYILGLEVVTPTGDIIRTGGKTLKNVVGYDLTKLFVGSEGTLGIITKITLKLIPKPAAKKTMLVQFESIDGAAQSVSAIIGAKIIPTTLEFLDAATIGCIRGKSDIPLPENCQAVLIIEVDGDPELLDAQAERILTIIEPFQVLDTRIATTDEESEKIWKVRRIVSPSLRQVNPDKFNEDIVVPRSKVPDMIRALEAISKKYNVPIVNFGHAGDGNIHVNVMVDLREEGMREKVEIVMDEIFRAAVELKGSISGEHGIGTSKAKYMSMELNRETIDYMQRIKAALDPQNILNPGKIFIEDALQPAQS
ncbi:FAD-binding oxidoreductase [Desulforhopalus sp. IMCC35007]|uniref:FAD-binding oxidoreductase n=1 Tax=Desulforhopalus sp. IMCC35007 TaxID=2569543 RepID=UPI0010ADCA05|nr:FAD-linked oxidase C-terminal domain-containing protein [Desulforhopalus sp. IMCC35007]TKB07314.1 FAD-binding protein [Desulforhopalus sp. IMCC35007]